MFSLITRENDKANFAEIWFRKTVSKFEKINFYFDVRCKRQQTDIDLFASVNKCYIKKLPNFGITAQYWE